MVGLLLSKKHILVNLEIVGVPKTKHSSVNQDNYALRTNMCCVIYLPEMYTDDGINEITATKVTVYYRHTISMYSCIYHRWYV